MDARVVGWVWHGVSCHAVVVCLVYKLVGCRGFSQVSPCECVLFVSRALRMVFEICIIPARIQVRNHERSVRDIMILAWCLQLAGDLWWRAFSRGDTKEAAIGWRKPREMLDCHAASTSELYSSFVWICPAATAAEAAFWPHKTIESGCLKRASSLMGVFLLVGSPGAGGRRLGMSKNIEQHNILGGAFIYILFTF